MKKGAGIPQSIIDFCDENGYFAEVEDSTVFITKDHKEGGSQLMAKFHIIDRLDYKRAFMVQMMKVSFNYDSVLCAKFRRNCHTNMKEYYVESRSSPVLLDEMMELSKFKESFSRKPRRL